MADELTRRFLDGVARHRMSGAPALACLAGTRRVRDGAPGFRLGADGPGAAGPTDLAMLVDLAAGAGIRSTLGAHRRLATTSMAVHLLEPLPALELLSVRAQDPASTEQLAVSGTTVLAGDHVVGHGSVAFALLGDGFAPIPWEQEVPPDVPPLAEDDLTPGERAGLVHVRAAASGTGPGPGSGSWSEAVLRGATRPGPVLPGATGSGGVLQPTSLLANRAGGVQGGVLVGAVVQAAIGDGPARLSSVQVDFVSPGSVHSEIGSVVEVLRAGRRSTLVAVELRQGDAVVVVATVLLRLP